MSLVKTTATGNNYLRKINTGADIGYVSNLALFDKKLGGDAVGNKVFLSTWSYVVGSHTLLVFVNGQLAEAVDTLPAGVPQYLLYKEIDEYTIEFDVALLNEDVVTFMIIGTVRPPMGEGNLIPVILDTTGIETVPGYRYLVDTTSFLDASPLTVDLPLNPTIGFTVGFTDLATNYQVSRLRIQGNGEKIMHSTLLPNEYSMDVITKNASFKLLYANTLYGWRVVG